MEGILIMNRKILLSLLLAILVLFSLSAVSADEIHVNGTSFSNVSTAINSTNNGDVVFLDNQIFTGTGTEIGFTKSNIVICGGHSLGDGETSTLDANGKSRIMSIMEVI